MTLMELIFTDFFICGYLQNQFDQRSIKVSFKNSKLQLILGHGYKLLKSI